MASQVLSGEDFAIRANGAHVFRQPSFALPLGTTLLDTQVAGHEFDAEKHKLGLLRGPKGRVLKPVVKPILGKREIEFYENLQNSKDPTDVEILRYTPTFYGTREMRIFGRKIKFIQLSDITEGMIEPCVMDVKIGKQTWDPLATPEKRESEARKYAESKQAYGFCVPGFQVHKLSNGSICKYGKDYGRKLNSKTVVEALETFLNVEPDKPPCRDLVVRLLSILWKILALFRSQKKYKFYSSSLLIAYDTNRLRRIVREFENNIFDRHKRLPPTRCRTYSAGASGLDATANKTAIAKKLLNQNGPSVSPNRSPKHRTIDRLMGLQRSISLTKLSGKSKLQEERSVYEDYRMDRYKDTRPALRRFYSTDPNLSSVHKLCRTHSYTNNFEADIVQMKEDYAILLAELSSTCEEKQDWVKVYMIDFAHIFPSHDLHDLDANYLNGIENLIKLLESFLQ